MSTTPDQKYRLVTRADLDGLVCAALLMELELIDEMEFVHPKDVQDGKVPITARDITTNLPYDPRCHLAFDHHVSETFRFGERPPGNLVLDPRADSAARVVYRHYGGHKRFPEISEHMIMAVDKADAARFTSEEVLRPSGWALLNFVMDPRTGLGRFSDFRVSNWELLRGLVDHCRRHTVEEILALPDVAERVKLYFAHEEAALKQLRRCSGVRGNVVVLDLRNEATIYACNRFVIYALYPQCTSSIHVLWGRAAQNTVLAIGHSIFNRGSFVNIGELCLAYGGGGHANAGTIQVAHADAERVLGEVVSRLAPMVEEATADQDELDGVPAAAGGPNGETLEDPATGRAGREVDPGPLDRDIAARSSRSRIPADGLTEETRAVPGDEHTLAESILEQTLAENGMTLVPTRDEIRRINERLERIERLLAELTPIPTSN